MHFSTVDEQLLKTAKARGTAEREMAVSAEQLFATLEHGPSWSKWVPVISGGHLDEPEAVRERDDAHFAAGARHPG
jgi:hypothetical protein